MDVKGADNNLQRSHPLFNLIYLDINECEANLGKCTNGRCVNTDGSFRCDCDKGFTLSTSDPTKCEG